MHALNPEALKALAERATPPCLSVYQTTHRSHPDNQQDRMVFRGHVKSLATSLAQVADSFHTQPLRRILQSVDRYQVLCLSRDKAKLWEGNRDGLAEIKWPESVPQTASEALGDHLKEEGDLDTERYFRLLDRVVMEHCSKPSGLPLLLVALPEHHHRFRQSSHNAALIPEGLEINPDALDSEALCARAWAAMTSTRWPKPRCKGACRCCCWKRAA